jgi:hypothetical protein
MGWSAMGLKHLTKDEQQIVLRCIRAIVEGPFLCEGDFHSIIGLERSEAATVASRWPSVDESEEDVHLAINNSMNALLIWFGWQDEDPASGSTLLRHWTGATPEEIERVFEKWRTPQQGTNRQS